MIPLEAKGHTVPYLKGLIHGKDESRELRCGCTTRIYQDVMKSDNLLHKWGFGDSLSQTTVRMCSITRLLSDFPDYGFQKFEQKFYKQNTMSWYVLL